MSSLKSKLQAGKTVHGCWLNMGAALSAEMVSHAGFDWVLIDLEHGAGSEQTLIPELQALEASSVVPLVRVESFQQARVQRVLDAGVKGVMFPRIRSAAEAREAISNMYYPPRGRRGLTTMSRANQFGKNFEDYFASSEKELLGIIQIETKECLDELDEIAAIDGVDVLFVGPADLSLSLGILHQWDHPLFIEAVKATGAAALKAGKAAGILFPSPTQYDFYYQSGFRFIACGSDSHFLKDAAFNMVNTLNEYRKKNQ